MPVFELTGGTIGKRELVGSQQFYVHYGEAFTVHFKLDGVKLHLHFRQEFNGDNAGGYFKIDETMIDEKNFYAILGNFNQKSVTTGPIRFCHDKAGKDYSFQVAAEAVGTKPDEKNIWRYTLIFYQEAQQDGKQDE